MVFNVQVLRAVAATLVVWVHAGELVGGNMLPEWAKQFGYGGVDLFFVISGFIMVRTTQGRHVSPFIFMKKRITRVVPLYYFFTLSTAMLAIMAPALLNSTQPTLSRVAKSLLFVPYEKSEGRIYPLYYLGWTLNYEMMFYLLFSLSLFLPKQTRVVVVTAVLAALALVGTGVDNLSDYGVVAFFYTRPILLDFVLGMFVAASLPAWTPSVSPVPWLACLAVGIAWFVFGGKIAIGDLPIAPPTDTFLRFGVPSGLVVAAAVALEQTGTRIGTILMGKIGNASYSVYLSHYFFVACVIAAANWLTLGDSVRALLAPATVIAAVAISFATYHLIERPLAGDLGGCRSLAASCTSVARRLMAPGEKRGGS